MNKTTMVLATVATLGLCSTAFAASAAPAMKEQLRPAHSQALVTHKKRSGHYVVMHGHKVWVSYQAHGKGKKHLASHVTGNQKKRTKS